MLFVDLWQSPIVGFTHYETCLSRNEMSFKGKKDKDLLKLDGVECITLKEERKIEEAPGAYKEIGPVINSQVEEGLVNVVAIFSPLVTFKA